MVKKLGPLVKSAPGFKEVVDALCTSMTHQRVATNMDCSVAALRAALRDPTSAAFRKPPGGWEVSARQLLLSHAEHLTSIAQRISPVE